MNKVQIKHLRVMLLAAWVAVSGLLLLGSCAAERWEDEPEERPDPVKKYAVSFAPLAVAEAEVTEGGQTRAAEPTPLDGTLRLLVYEQSADMTTADPVANKLYTVTTGRLTEADGEGPLELYAGTYRFYALSPSTVNPVKGIATVQHGDDPLASLTTQSVSPIGETVTLAPLSHKASKVSFTVSKAEDATFIHMGRPWFLTLYSQTDEPSNFQLGEGGGAIALTKGIATVLLGGPFHPFTQPDAGKNEFYAECILLPKVLGAFNVAIETELTWPTPPDGGGGSSALPPVLRAKVPEIAFEPGKMYNFHIRVKDPRELGEVQLTVTPWNTYEWEDEPIEEFPVLDLAALYPDEVLTRAEAMTRCKEINEQEISDEEYVKPAGVAASGRDGTWNAKMSPLFQVMRANLNAGQLWVTAYDACRTYSGEGGAVGQWRLPTLEELLKIRASQSQLEGKGGFTAFDTLNYWSCTEGSTDSAWYVDFSSDGTGSGIKASSSYRVRCVRDL